MPLETTLIYLMIVVGGIFACLIIIYAMRKNGKTEEIISEGEKPETDLRGFPFKIAKTVHREEAGRAKDELRLLDLEREILSDAIRRLYEAHAAGKITEEERDQIGETYKSRMIRVKETMEKGESLVALHELETMQEDLLKLFSDRFGELSGKIGDLRARVEPESIEEIPVVTAKKQGRPVRRERPSKESVEKKRKEEKAKTSRKTEAERRIEKIREEVEKVLDRLGQMEIET